jgi:hypothetical protein
MTTGNGAGMPENLIFKSILMSSFSNFSFFPHLQNSVENTANEKKIFLCAASPKTIIELVSNNLTFARESLNDYFIMIFLQDVNVNEQKTNNFFMYLWPTYYTLEIRVYIPTLPLF